MKSATEVCPLCAGSGWKPVPGALERGVTRCDCLVRARAGSLIAAARIPKRYEHCELSNFDTEDSWADPTLARAHMEARGFVKEYPLDRKGLLLVGNVGSGKTHLAVGIVKALIREKGIECVFYDYAELLKQIQDSYNPAVQATELSLLKPVFEADVVVLDDLGSIRPTEWRWDTIRLMLNTRYNNERTTIITTNFADEPAAAVSEPDATKKSESWATAKAAARKDTLGDRIGEPMRSRLHEMCRVVNVKGSDFRERVRSASFS